MLCETVIQFADDWYQTDDSINIQDKTMFELSLRENKTSCDALLKTANKMMGERAAENMADKQMDKDEVFLKNCLNFIYQKMF